MDSYGSGAERFDHKGNCVNCGRASISHVVITDPRTCQAELITFNCVCMTRKAKGFDFNEQERAELQREQMEIEAEQRDIFQWLNGFGQYENE